MKRTGATMIIAALLASSGAAGAVRPSEAIPKMTPAAIVTAPESGGTQAATVTKGRAGPLVKNKRRFFGLPLFAAEALFASGGGLLTAGFFSDSSQNREASPQ